MVESDVNKGSSAWRLIITVVLVGVLAAAAFFCWKWTLTKRAAIEPVQVQVPTVDVVAVTLRQLFREDILPAEIEAYQDTLIYPKVPGFIEWIGVDRGSVVKKGQLMVRMYAPEYLARRNDALAKVAAARAAVAAEESKLQDIEADLKKRQASLIADQSTSERVAAASMVPGVIAVNDVVQWAQTVEAEKQEVDSVIKRVNAKDHEVAMRKEELQAEMKNYENTAFFASYLEIRAPFNGYITDRRLHVGSFVGPDGTGAYPPICRIKQLDLLRIVAPVPEADTAGVVAGTEVKFSVSAFPGKTFVGTLARISNSLFKVTRTMPVELNYLNPDYKILPGMFCEVHWPIRRRQSSMFVPLSAVVSTQLDTFVCKVKDGVVDWVSVSKGQIMNGMVEVFGSLHQGDLVVIMAKEDVLNKSKVVAVLAKPTPEKDLFSQD
jgi:membrane fusion protein (multidrug efflux system)